MCLCVGLYTWIFVFLMSIIIHSPEVTSALSRALLRIITICHTVRKCSLKQQEKTLILTPSGNNFGESIIVLAKNKSVVKTQSVLIPQSKQNETAEELYSSIFNDIQDDLDNINVLYMFYFYHLNP